MTTAVLLLAAGQSRRFGKDDKLLAPLNGTTVIEEAMAPLGADLFTSRLAVVSSQKVAAVAQRAGFETIFVPAGDVQSSSLKQGIAAIRLKPVARVLIALADMPFLQRDDIVSLLDLSHDQPGCMLMRDTPMPPAVFPVRMLDSFQHLTGDRGAGTLLRDIPQRSRLPVNEERLRDIDLPNDL
ncbi:MAG: nucleotidyltransferase family protein [Paracoccus denitrificans]|uniref:Nucleotidyltransferase family protein n=1 Tax=Paracoccus denitrificans TaxID=266 RepID=A0A533I8D1_PARDE|nr:MAG: nucleotidyltransferase family protein [Paracoccus denitrificans]